MMKINWFTLVLKLIAVYGLYLIVLDITTSKTSAFCMALGVMLLLVLAEGLLENYLKERKRKDQQDLTE
jgi:hypothetical protein